MSRLTCSATMAVMMLLEAPAAWGGSDIDNQLHAALQQAGFTGKIESTLVPRLGRPINSQLAELGRLLFFDTLHSLHDDNTCAGCHSPVAGFGDTQSIAIGVQNNGIVGPHRTGPRNQRRTPSIVNTAFYPKLMWNGRFSAPSGDPFNNSQGFLFPPPEGSAAFLPNDGKIKHLLQAQGQLPPTELVEVAGFTGTAGTIGPRFDQFDDGKGGIVPAPDASGFRNEPIRHAALARLNTTPKYRQLSVLCFPKWQPARRLTFPCSDERLQNSNSLWCSADAPIDRFARGDNNALSANQKLGALISSVKADASLAMR